MIKRLLVQVVETITSTDSSEAGAQNRETALRLATAVLMLDVARADHVFDESEFDRALKLIETHFDLTPEEAAQLVNLASEKAKRRTSSPCFGRSPTLTASSTNTKTHWC